MAKNEVRVVVRADDQTGPPINRARQGIGGLQDVVRQYGAIASTVFAGAAVAAAKMALDFESTLTKLQTQVGVSAEEVDKFGDAIKGLSGEVAQAPTQLAEGLLAIQSAGIEGAGSLEVLEQSAKLAAIGLGDTETVSRSLTAALVTYSEEGLTAAQASDQLLAAVQAGAAEADEFAGALGRVIGIANQVGVSFGELTAFVATFTRVGVSAEEAVTALRSVFTTIIAPSNQAREALAAVGLTTEELRQLIAERGLAPALIHLLGLFEGNVEALAAVIPNVRALSGVLGTAGAQAEDFVAIEEEIVNATGNVDEAFTTVSNTTEFKLKQAMADVQVAAIDLGGHALPLVADAAETLSTVLEVGEGDLTAYGDALANIATGPLGNFIPGVRDARLAIDSAKTGFDLTTDALGAMGLGFASAGDEAQEMSDEAVAASLEMAAAFNGLLGQTQGVIDKVLEIGTANEEAVAEAVPALEDLGGFVDEVAGKYDDLEKAIRGVFEQESQQQRESQALISQYEAEIATLELLANRNGELTNAQALRLLAVEDLLQGEKLHLAAMDAHQQANSDTAIAELELADAYLENRNEQELLMGALRDSLALTGDFSLATQILEDRLLALRTPTEKLAEDVFPAAARAIAGAREEADDLTERGGFLLDRLVLLGDTDPHIEVTESGIGTVTDAARGLRDALDEVRARSVINVAASLSGTVGGLFGGQHGLVGDFGQGTLTMLHGPEAVLPLENEQDMTRVMGQVMRGPHKSSFTSAVDNIIDMIGSGDLSQLWKWMSGTDVGNPITHPHMGPFQGIWGPILRGEWWNLWRWFSGEQTGIPLPQLRQAVTHIGDYIEAIEFLNKRAIGDALPDTQPTPAPQPIIHQSINISNVTLQGHPGLALEAFGLNLARG